MAGVILELDPVSEDAANVSLVLVDNVTYFLLGEDWPSPPLKQSFADSISTEGSVPVTFKHDNRSGQISLRVVGSTSAALQTAVNYIDKKVQKIIREGGTLKRTAPSGDVYFLDLLGGEQNVTFDKRFMTNNRAMVTISLGAKPYWRQVPRTLSSHSETTLPCLIFTEPSGSSAYFDAVLADTPVSYWRLAEPSGTTATDNRAVNNGTYQGTPTLNQTSPILDTGDKSVTFSGATTQRVDIPHNASLALTTTLTIEAWVNPTDRLQFYFVLTKDNAGGFFANPYEFRLEQTTGKPNLIVGNGATATGVIATAAVPTGSWSHIAVTIDGSGNVTHYLNGVANGTGSTGAQARTDGGATAMIAGRNDLGAAGFKGSLDEVAIYNTVLSGARIAAHYAAGSAVTVSSIKGDVPALGKLVITEAQAQDQFWLTYGIQSRYYSSSADAALFYEAEGRTPQGGSAATAVGPSGASGGGSNTVLASSLGTIYQSVLSTQATGGGNHLSHVGDYQVYARIQAPTTNGGIVSVALEWAQGDFLKATRNTGVSIAAGGAGGGVWRLMDLGQVSLTKVAQGTQRWEGRILAKTTFGGDDIYIDYLMFVPITEGSSQVSGLSALAAPSTFTARDEFDQTAGALAAKTLPVGGTWSGAGDADDFAVETTGKTAQRTAVSDTSGAENGRFAIAGTTTFTNLAVQFDFKMSLVPSTNVLGISALLRWTDINNFALILVTPSGATGTSGLSINLVYRVAGTYGAPPFVTFPTNLQAGVFYTLRVAVFASGRYAVWLGTTTPGSLSLVFTGIDSVLATGGALASGKVGFWDAYFSATANTRNYDNFAAWVPASDAAVFASRQAEIRHDRVIRQDSSGSFWNPVSKIEGDYLLIPPSGREGRTTRIIVKASRGNPALMPDSSIDDISATLTYTPRFLNLPE